MKYIIIENSGSAHELGIFSIAQILKSQGKDVSILVSKKHLNRTKELNSSYGFHITKISVFSLIKMRFLEVNAPYLVFNTISTRNCLINSFIAMVYFGRTVFYIRNARSWVLYQKHNFSIKNSLLRAVTYVCKKIMLLTRHSLLVEKETIRNFLRSNGIEDVDIIPFIFYHSSEYLEKRNTKKVLEIVSPGVIDFKTKNLILVLEACEMAIASGSDIKLTFLGKPRTETERKICSYYKKKFKTKFFFFDCFVSEKDFKNSVSSSDVIVGAFQINHTCKYFEETCGTTKGSGVDAHAFSQAKILIVNEGYQVDDSYRNATLHYRTAQDLADHITSLYKNESFRVKLSNAANDAAENYTLKSTFQSIKYLGM